MRPLIPIPFSLSRWFAAVALVSIASISTVSGWLLSGFLNERMLRQEARLTQEFVDSLVLVENAAHFFRTDGAAPTKEVGDFFAHLARLPDVLRANLYSGSRTIIWSSDSSLVGRSFPDNPELEQALRGGVPGCQAGRAFLNVDERGRVSKCVEFRRPEDRAGDLSRETLPEVLPRLRQIHAANDCRACWMASRGEVEGLYTVRGLLQALPALVRA